MADEIQIIIPKGADMSDGLDHALVSLTEAVSQIDEELVAHGLLGGHFGYGARYENDVFVMRPFYWGDCDCGADERSEAWHEANPHASNCWQAERDRRWNAYDERIGWDEIKKAAFPGGGGPMEMLGMEEVNSPMPGVRMMISRKRDDAPMERWRKASDLRDKARAEIVRDLYIERGMKPEPYQWHCSCERDERARAADIGHRETCALELPNFHHKRSGLEVRWYKYIGRGMETKNAEGVDLTAVFSECLASLPKI